ncbi:hypothetical protein ACOME3_002461 [Neoechinorhynchus agilis]
MFPKKVPKRIKRHSKLFSLRSAQRQLHLSASSRHSSRVERLAGLHLAEHDDRLKHFQSMTLDTTENNRPRPDDEISSSQSVVTDFVNLSLDNDFDGDILTNKTSSNLEECGQCVDEAIIESIRKLNISQQRYLRGVEQTADFDARGLSESPSSDIEFEASLDNMTTQEAMRSIDVRYGFRICGHNFSFFSKPKTNSSHTVSNDWSAFATDSNEDWESDSISPEEDSLRLFKNMVQNVDDYSKYLALCKAVTETVYKYGQELHDAKSVLQVKNGDEIETWEQRASQNLRDNQVSNNLTSKVISSIRLLYNNYVEDHSNIAKQN